MLSETEALILSLLVAHRGRETYGLDLIEQSDGRLKRGTAYVTLHRMEKKGLLVSRAEQISPQEEGRPRRRLYRVTALGRQALNLQEKLALALRTRGQGSLS